ncbi:2-keto-4-pentenoate hydratase [Variibacter gotjawalensis]|uniref:2-keto-4-pentenoate hydratase n=1 Tax=Variibacter gotjawalensis TaxID=1333996 RepID=A0A0S3PU80_9BRAD|nr:fumarylacetoacetate hydrolase family protein [Variibacter gotjawalensis]NIK49790.1 2-keto-4-pentenoate hydratase [Variibacter gotjawalensis]RZS45794.1 2-oxo-3-hexenedioate decarboxylase/2-keto-4-pentenoate hydratase [Variibacter gotjawalensis]BAT59467.1 2-keto-4-pentenoate hydratase [Variibacter gotjawalensis]
MDLNAIADNLLQAHEARARFVSFAAENGVDDIAKAYSVQEQLVARLTKSNGESVGYKIGLTSHQMQAMCGIAQPIGGRVLKQRVHASGATVARADFGRVGLEFEIGLRLGRDLDGRNKSCSVDEIVAAIDGVCAAIELVDDRNADYAKLDVLSLICDNSWNAGAVLSDFQSMPSSLRDLEGKIFENGTLVDRGSGEDVLGDPVNSLAWLCEHLAGRGKRLRKGEIVLTGSLVKTRFPQGPTAYRYDLSDIGSISVQIT